MKPLLYFSLIIFTLSAATPAKSQTSSYPLNGRWIPVKQELNGKELPASIYEKDTLVLKDSAYTYTSHDQGAALYNDGKMDIYGRKGINAGKHYTAIYKLENGQLIICYNLAGDSYPGAFETKSKSTLFLSTYKKGED